MADQQIRALGLLKTALSGLTARQRATASNIANVDTPGYTPTHVDFESLIREEIRADASGPDLPLRASDPLHMTPEDLALAGSLRNEKGILRQRNDGSSVDIEQEVLLMADTEIRSSAVVGLLKTHFGWLRGVISDGRR